MLKKFFLKTKELTAAEMRLRDNFLIKYLGFIPWQIKPNHITALRFLVAWLFFLPQSVSARLALFFTASGSLSDIIDGVLARKRNQITNFGKVFDPMTDKLMAAGILWYLFFHNLIGLKLIIHIILPETLLVIYGFWFLINKEKIKQIPEPNIWGRAKFILYLFGFIFLLISQINDLDPFLSNLGFLFITIGIVLAWVSQIVSAQEVIKSIQIRPN